MLLHHCTYNTQFSYMREKHISVIEAYGHDHVEETMGYEHTVEGMSALLGHERSEKTYYHDTITTTKEIEGNELCG